MNQIPVSHDGLVPILTPEDIVKEVKEGKKTSSRVIGDIFVNVLTKCINTLARPICTIFNTMMATGTWPKHWKTEYVTVIPKTKAPESESQCRNISCTNFLSKLFERFVMRWCQEYVMPKGNQFGGQKGCSTYHFLADTLDQVTEHLEDSRAASILTSVDYSKAFNRVEHLPLLEALKNKGTPNHLIRILAAFLMDRQMTVRVGRSYSKK